MTATVRRIALLLALFIVVVFAVFLFNQTAQIVQSARDVNPTFGNGVMWGLIFTYCLLADHALYALVQSSEAHVAASSCGRGGIRPFHGGFPQALVTQLSTTRHAPEYCRTHRCRHSVTRQAG